MDVDGVVGYHFVPRCNTVAQNGILTLSKLPPDHPAWDKYAERALMHGYPDVRSFLLGTRGQWGTHTVSLLYHIPPLPLVNAPIFRFCTKRTCYQVDLGEMIKNGVVTKIWVVGIPERRIEIDPQSIKEEMDRHMKQADYTGWYPLIFQRVPHLLVAVREGYIPCDYLTLIKSNW